MADSNLTKETLANAAATLTAAAITGTGATAPIDLAKMFFQQYDALKAENDARRPKGAGARTMRIKGM